MPFLPSDVQNMVCYHQLSHARFASDIYFSFFLDHSRQTMT
jgi:hypothetical protein